MSARRNIFFLGKGKKDSVTFLLCLLLAAGIWVLNSLNNTHVTTLKIPVVYELTGNDQRDFQVPEFLELEIKGRGFTLLELIRSLKKEKIRPLGSMNMSNDTVLNSLDAVRPLLQSFNKEIEITRITPAQFFLSGNKSHAKKVAIRKNYTLKCKPSFLPSGPSVFYPDSVYLFSSSPIPEDLKEVYSEYKVFENAEKTIVRKLLLQVPKGDYHLSSNQSWLYIPIEAGTEISLEVPIGSKTKYAQEVFIPSYVKVTCLVPLSKYTLTRAPLFTLETEESGLMTDRVMVRLKRAPYWADKIRWEPTVVDRFVKK